MEKKKDSKKFLLMVSIIIIILIISVITIILLNKKDSKTNKNIQVNAPQLIEGMTPVKWQDNKWVETTTDDKDWYNYANKKWANVKLADGSMFVWIPRYAYKITEGYHGEDLEYKKQSSLTDSTKQGGKVDIVFLNGVTNNTFDNKKIDSTNTNSKNDYVIHSAFKFGDEDLQGVWVSKYEASRLDATDTIEGNQEILSFKENKLSITNYDLNSIMYYCRDMERQNVFGWTKQEGKIANTGDIIEDSNNFDTHLIKNIEWGTVCYLAESKYGINKEIQGNASLISGKGGISSTTTGNETGIYDMAGQNAEFVSAYYNIGTDKQDLNKYTNVINFDKKYVDIYNSYGTDNYGDCIYETSKDNSARRSWYEGQSDFSMFYPFFLRGKSSYSNCIYSYFTANGDKTNDYNEFKKSFRATIVISTDVLSEEENKEKSETIRKENMQKTKSDNLNTLLNSLNNNYTKGYLDEMDLFTNTQTITDINFTKLREYYENFKTDYENFKNNISQYEELQSEMAEVIQTTDEFLNEFDKATTQNNDVNIIIQSFENSSNKWTESYKLVYKMLYGKELDI